MANWAENGSEVGNNPERVLMDGGKGAFRELWWASSVPRCDPKRSFYSQLVRQLEPNQGPK